MVMKRRAPNANNVWPNLKERLALVPTEPGTSTITSFASSVARNLKLEKDWKFWHGSGVFIFGILWWNQRYEDHDHGEEEGRIKRRTSWWEFLVGTFVCKELRMVEKRRLFMLRRGVVCIHQTKQSKCRSKTLLFLSFFISQPLPLFYSLIFFYIFPLIWLIYKKLITSDHEFPNFI